MSQSHELSSLPQSHALADIEKKIAAGTRLDRQDALRLFHSKDLLSVGVLARLARRRRLGPERELLVYWNRNLYLNPTNICVASCKFCLGAFGRRRNDPAAYTMTLGEAVRRAREAVAAGATEVHITGGLNPKAELPYYEELFAAIREAAPTLHIKGLTAVEIDFFCRINRVNEAAVLSRLKAAGLQSLTGGGAEIFSSEIRRQVCPDKCDGAIYLKIHGVAHRLGIGSNCSMLSGIGEEPQHRVDHLLALREQQDRTQGFRAFIPLVAHYEGTALAGTVERLTGSEILKIVAVSRLVLDNFDYIQAYWVQLGEHLAQTALAFGANDMNGTIIDERITVAAGARRRSIEAKRLEHLIEAAGFVSAERDTCYNVLSPRTGATSDGR